ncbi:MAG: hypothetical protein N5P05_001769 [Chroococcopsis gigantea SAG 12.99]|jgi:hypothetical protein|nr:hypothetical protein [Chroococcopsis gigantea SAG 12.99]
MRSHLWLIGNASWLFGIFDRLTAIYNKGNISTIPVIELGLAVFFFIGWLFLKPTNKFR